MFIEELTMEQITNLTIDQLLDEYSTNYYWAAEGWGDSADHAEKNLVTIREEIKSRVSE